MMNNIEQQPINSNGSGASSNLKIMADVQIGANGGNEEILEVDQQREEENTERNSVNSVKQPNSPSQLQTPQLPNEVTTNLVVQVSTEEGKSQ